MSDYMTSARAALAVAFPPQDGLRGACTTLADLCRAAYRRPRYTSLAGAARDCIRRNYENAEAYGSGNRASRRAKAFKSANL